MSILDTGLWGMVEWIWNELRMWNADKTLLSVTLKI